jgi:16S rRNA U516 pseudouridylate synthase RsuA-like enzyme
MTNPEETEVVNEEVRLQKALAAAGVASRRACEELIVKGQVKVNGKLVTELGSRVNPAVDKVTVRGVPVQFDTTRVYLLLNKPAGIISTMADEEGRPDLSSFVADYDRVFNIGRLDAETTGLLLLTNDGELANQLSHPSFGVEKTYIARVVGEVTPMSIHKLMSGFELEDGFIKADRARGV